MASTYVSPVFVCDFIELVINKSTFAWLASLLCPPSWWRRFLRLVLNGVESYMPVCTCSTGYKSTVKKKITWNLQWTYYSDCAVPYVRHFCTGYSILISLWFNEVWPYASLNHNVICHMISGLKMPHLRDCAITLLCVETQKSSLSDSLAIHTKQSCIILVLKKWLCCSLRPKNEEGWSIRNLFFFYIYIHIAIT